MELQNGHEKKNLKEESSDTMMFTPYNLKEDRKETEDSDNVNSDVYSEEEQDRVDITHDNLQHLSSSNTKATNWSMKMKAEYSVLQSMKKYLLEHSSFKAIRGCLEKHKSESQTNNLQLMLKFVNPTIQSTIYKLVKKCPHMSDNASVTVYAVTQAEHIKKFLDSICKKSNENKEVFEKGEFKYSRRVQEKKINAMIKIEEIGLHNARLWWANKNLPYKEFTKAESQYHWVQNVKRCAEITKQPEEEQQIEPMSKIKELGLSEARIWWADRNLPCTEFKKAENQYQWVENVKKCAEIKNESFEGKKTEPMSKIIELGLSKARLWWAEKHLPYNEFEKAEAQYHWEEQVKNLAGSTKESERDSKVEPIQKIEEMGLSRAGEWWAENHLPFEEFDKAEAQYNWEQEKTIRTKLRKQSEEYKDKLYPWQNYVYDIFKQVPDMRKIYVVLDKDGGNGKTTLQNMLTDLHPDEVVDIKNGKTRDMTYLAKNIGKYKMIQLNLTRQTIDTVNLSAMESMKDGNFASMKYTPKKIRMEPPHVVIYTNTTLKWEDLTEDRLEIIHLSREYKEGFQKYTLLEWKDINSKKNFDS
jgi:hypothetical protein